MAEFVLNFQGSAEIFKQAQAQQQVYQRWILTLVFVLWYES
jgi:hypothetical protein